VGLTGISWWPGATVILEKLPPGLLDGLPAEDQAALSVIVGVPIRFSGFDEDGRLDLRSWKKTELSTTFT
jgi:hypothetical protein